MIVKENKASIPLGKRVNLLGLHQVLIHKIDPREATNCSKGKDWVAIEKKCIHYGF